MDETKLTARQLLVLLLRKRGYSPAQIAELLHTDAERVQEIACAAARHLGTADWPQAVAEAQRRGLI